ncbi:MAG: CDGSH iron-sulfur domain-containing protein [Verrucomicrobiota bacterium]
MSEPVRASDGPLAVEVEEGKSYFWCSCGLSKTQPLCDGGHAGSGFSPVKHEAKKTGTVYFCGCKATKNAPMCDGSHSE